MKVTMDGLERIYHTNPGNAVIYRLVGKRLVPLFFSESIADMCGMTMGEYQDFVHGNDFNIVLENDRPGTFDVLKRSLTSGTDVDYSYRLYHKTDGFIWVHTRARYLGEMEGDPVVLASIENTTQGSGAFSSLLDHSINAIYVFDRKTREVYYINQTAIDAWKVADYRERRCYEVFGRMDTVCPWCPLEMEKQGDGETLPVVKKYNKHLKKWYSIEIRTMQWYGRDVYAAFLTDITDSQTNQENLSQERERLLTTLNTIPTGLCLYIKEDGAIKRTFVNRHLSELIGLSMEALQQETYETMFDRIHPEDQEQVKMDTERVFREGHVVTLCRVRNQVTGQYMWMRREGVSVTDADGNQTVYTCYIDLTQQVEAEQALKESETRYENAIKGANFEVWEYDIVNHAIVSPSGSFKKRGVPERIKNVPESILPVFVEEERPKVIQLFKDVEEGSASTLKGQFWMRWKPDSPLFCEDVTCTVVRDGTGKPVKVYGIGRDITDEKLEEERYDNTLRAITSANPHTQYTIHLNLTRNKVVSVLGTSPLVDKLTKDVPVDQLFEEALHLLKLEPGDERISLLSRTELMDRFYRGETSCSVDNEIGKYDGRKNRWLTAYITLVKNPRTGDIELFDNTIDTTESRTERAIIKQISQKEFDYIAVIDTNDDTFQIRNRKPEMNIPIPEDVLHYRNIKDYLLRCVVPEDLDMVMAGTSQGNVLRRLEETELYTLAVSMKDDQGRLFRKQFQYCYLDEAKSRILMTRRDITDAFQQERENARKLEEKTEQLKVALTAAKQASSAKSNFLSRMSHEIRTPMNAIIGMATLAAQKIGDDERVSDCISKIGMSSRYLLSLINDILDMSRIESGKMLLKNEKFMFREFVSGINNIIYNQAEAKGLDYECVVSNDVDDSYIGDAMKLQQVLINVLGNAVKFTDKGKVSLEIRQLSRRDNFAKVRFVINDTGCGISDDFMERIFEPFEQQDTTTTTVFGGTGLGLAITKSFVDLMAGSINVRSIVGVGSEFTIDVPLTVDESLERMPKLEYHFEKLRTLIVDDDLVVCEQASSILKDIGMITEYVMSGMEAVERVKCRNEEKSDYHYILIDWKMPDMDGIETTRQIRRIVGPDVTIIIISAYDWEALESEAKAAGANLLISKPLFKSTLISAFQKARGSMERQKEHPLVFDFTGKRVLVAEDNQINAEIAKYLLEDKQVTVEIAVNGLKAMEMFISNPPGYYDAILMDVRMPMMDGLQATVNIRHWNRKDARTIPIIAMTANAFDEDVEKSKAAGMNAHLAKPVDPELLYRTLEHAFEDDHADRI